MPEGEDLEVLLPLQVGDYARQSVRKLGDIHRDPIYADYYTAAGNHVFVELGICQSPQMAREALMRSKAETDAEFPELKSVNIFANRQEPSFFRTCNRLGAFMSWTRCGYFFPLMPREETRTWSPS